MYFKLVVNHTTFGGTQNLGYTSYNRYLMEDLRGIILGTITNTSQLSTYAFQSSASVITGTAPSTGMYTAGYYNTNTSNATDQFFQIKKRHHGYLQDNTNFDAHRYMHFRWITSNSISVQMGSHVTDSTTGISNAMPSTGGRGMTGYNGDNGNFSYGYDRPSYHHSWEGIINDSVFVLKINLGDPNSTSSLGSETFVMVDQEYQPNLDNHMRANYQYYCPMTAMGFACDRLEFNNMQSGKTSTTYDYKGLAMGTVQTQGAHGNNYNSNWTSTSYYNSGYFSTNKAYGYYVHTQPPMWWDMPNKLPGADGNANYAMYPLHHSPHVGLVNTYGGSYHKDYKEHSKLIGMWRTNDDSFFTGERVTDSNGRAYRAFRLYKCGDVNSSGTGYANGFDYDATHSRSATYLFPEAGTN